MIARTVPGASTGAHRGARLALRTGLAIMATVQALVGAVALFFPRSFYARVPGVDLLPPYNEHLMTDVGELNLAIASGLVIAAVTLDRLLVRTVLAGYLLYAVPHLVFHLSHLSGFGTGTAVVQTAGLVILMLLPLGLLILTRSRNGVPGPGRKRRSGLD